MSELERLGGSFYLFYCCHDYSGRCRIGSCHSQSDLTFEWRSVLHRWPSCLLHLEAHRFECKGRSDAQTEHAIGQERKPLKIRACVLSAALKSNESKAYYITGLICCFSMKSCSSSDPLLPLTGCQEQFRSCVDVCTDAEELSSAYVLILNCSVSAVLTFISTSKFQPSVSQWCGSKEVKKRNQTATCSLRAQLPPWFWHKMSEESNGFKPCF